MQNFKSSPLWLIAFFMSIAEVAAAYTVTQSQGNVQIALLVFFIGYALMVTCSFFAFLWFKPANFYAPSEYGSLPPSEYAKALANLPSEALNAVEAVRLDPMDEDKIFKVMDTLLPEEIKQHLILMSKNNNQISLPEMNEMGFTHSYEIILKNKSISFGMFSPHKFLSKLNGTSLVTYSDSMSKIFLSDSGKRFTEWLVRHEKEAETFKSEIGKWGKDQSIRDIFSEQSNAHNNSLQRNADASLE